MKIRGVSEGYWEVGVCGAKNTGHEATSPFQAITAVLTVTRSPFLVCPFCALTTSSPTVVKALRAGRARLHFSDQDAEAWKGGVPRPGAAAGGAGLGPAAGPGLRIPSCLSSQGLSQQ